MPQRIRHMSDDGLQLPIATGSAVFLYGWTLESIVLLLWAAYVLILILIKLPDLFGRYPVVGRAFRAAWGLVKGGRRGD